MPVADSIERIFEMVKQSALIHKTGGGTGFNFSDLRPGGTLVDSTQGTASGPVSFMRAFDVVTDVIKQGGVRRGANIGILNITHPDIMEFIDCKRDGKSFSNFNISIGLHSNFLEQVKNDEMVQLHFWGSPFREKIKARVLFDRLCENAWRNGEPGVLFLDNINKANPVPFLGRIFATNPCGEAPLLSFESCNLGSINLSAFVVDGKINYERLEEVVNIATRFLDDMIDVNKYPRIQIARKTRLTRKVGLGVMGWADMLGKLGIMYNTPEARELAEKLMKFIHETAHKQSTLLGKEKGYCFAKLKRRNTCVTTIAPTGTLSILADCSSSIEPHFARSYTKNVINGQKLQFDVPWKTVTSIEIAPEDHIKMQAAFQKYVDQGVSKTINLPNSATIEDIAQGIMLGHELGCKGMTFYRQDTREAPLQALSECVGDKCLI